VHPTEKVIFKAPPKKPSVPKAQKAEFSKETSIDGAAFKCQTCGKGYQTLESRDQHFAASHHDKEDSQGEKKPAPVQPGNPPARVPGEPRYPDTVTEKAIALLPVKDGKTPSRRWLKSCLNVAFEAAIVDFRTKVLTKENHLTWFREKKAKLSDLAVKDEPSKINREWKEFKDSKKNLQVINPPRTEEQREALEILKGLRARARKLPEELRKKVALPKARPAPKTGKNAPAVPKSAKSEPTSELVRSLAPLIEILKLLKSVS